MAAFEHRQRTRPEGIGTLVIATLTMGGIVLFQRLVFPELWTENRSFFIPFYGIGVVVYVLLCIYGVLNVAKNREFVCRIDDEVIECVSPVVGCGETFTLRLAEIAKIEREEWTDSHRWHIWDRAGRRYWLTDNYGNPTDRFVEEIRTRNAGVEVVRT